ncbi:hypothetical protein OOK36_18745 [Streptomyces sp. NBC_00365]|uniref:hypothetical protein n=1 Tax=Streptomyces sp. NBC_00365 TaxID=2975726 RepID=UPI0022564FA9|nr:hypothetical protein [Streptomyces sp. NBC_00365]MCX5090900.1 hypothetical protein [Streptomyces sp. NBC_00365]
MISAVVLTSHEVQRARDEMAALLLAGQRKLHWRNESARRRSSLARRTAAIKSEVVIATWCGMNNAHQERARRKAQQTLLAALVDRDVAQAVFESRGPIRDNGDIAGLAGLRRSGVLPESMLVSHAAGPLEHALWAADVVVGAFGAALDGTPEYWAEMLAGTKVTVLTCGQCSLSHAPDPMFHTPRPGPQVNAP